MIRCLPAGLRLAVKTLSHIESGDRAIGSSGDRSTERVPPPPKGLLPLESQLGDLPGHSQIGRSPDLPMARSPDSHVHPSQTALFALCQTALMTSQNLTSALEGFLSGSSGAVVMEDGAVVFDLQHAKYSVSGENNKCLLHLWSEERNIVRRVLDVESKGESLRVTVQKMGQLRPTRLDIHRERV